MVDGEDDAEQATPFVFDEDDDEKRPSTSFSDRYDTKISTGQNSSHGLSELDSFANLGKRRGARRTKKRTRSALGIDTDGVQAHQNVVTRKPPKTGGASSNLSVSSRRALLPPRSLALTGSETGAHGLDSRAPKKEEVIEQPRRRPIALLAADVGKASKNVALLEYRREEERVEREWYLDEDGGGDTRFFSQHADETSKVQRQAKRLSERAATRQADVSRWEERQMGFGMYAARRGRREVDPVDDGDCKRVTVLVREVEPEFLKSEMGLLGSKLPSLTESKSVILGERITMPVKDPTSDLAVMARQGSPTVKEFREKRDRGGKRAKYWELGSAAGAKAKESAENDKEREAKESAANRDGVGKDVKFGDAMKRYQTKNDDDADDDKNEKNSVEAIRRSLPVFKVRDDLMKVIRENQVVVVVGETGSGKTTQLAQYLHEDGYTKQGVVGCTQPRRVAAVSVAQRVAQEFLGGREVGDEVGYSIRFEDCTSQKTVIKYMTDGILLRETLSDPELDKYSVIIMDEAHERSVNTDVLFGVLRTVLAKRLDLRVIVTSATLNAEKFSEFFGHVPVFRIPGRTHPVAVFHRKSPSQDYVKDAVMQVIQIHLNAPLPGDILVFMSGQDDIETTCECIAEKLNELENPRPLLVLPIYSQLASDLQAKIFEPAKPGVRKVVVASNIAETSLTIDGIHHVVDSGFCKLKTYNPRLGMDALLLCPASKSSVEQRKGRAGRTGPGNCYRLFTAVAFKIEMLETNVPEIQRTNLSHVVLLLKSLGVKDLLDFPFLDPPPAENILKSMAGLWLLGALDGEGKLTDLGRRMSKFPLDPGLSALLFIGEQYNCLLDAITIVAMLSVPNVFVRPHGREDESDAAREKFFIPESDHLTLWHVYKRWRAGGARSDWCMKHFINWKCMRKAHEVREQLVDQTRKQNMTQSTTDDWEVIRRAVAGAYFYQAARRKGIGEYVNLRSGVLCGLHPTSAIFGSGLSPDYVVYHELVYTKKEFMSCVTSVEPKWLAESGPMLYNLRVAGDFDLQAALSR